MAKPNYMPTGLSKEAFDNMTDGAGALYMNLPVPTGERVYADELAEIMEKGFEEGLCFGATNGGISPDFSYEMSSVTTDGKNFEYVGSRSTQQTTGAISVNFQETSPNSFKYALPTSSYNEETDELTIRRSIPDDAYIPKLWAIVALRGGGYVGFYYENALAEGTSGNPTDDQPAEWSVTFTAYAKDLVDSQTAPFMIKWFPVKEDDPEAAGQSASIGPSSSSTKATKSSSKEAY